MATTTVRLDDLLEARLGALAERDGVTPHESILDAVRSAVSEAEDLFELERVATRKTVSLAVARSYLTVRASGSRGHRSGPRKRAR